MTSAGGFVKVLATTLVVAGIVAAPADAGSLQPSRGQVLFGVSDTGVNSDFTEFSELVGKHPALIETFRSWGASLAGSIKRWQKAEARPVLHISTADPTDGHELIDPRQIANGRGDGYLLELNQLFWSTRDPGLRPPAGRAQPVPQRVRVI